MTEYASFRQRLDAVLRTCNVQQVSEFLIAENQWSPGSPADPELAMWLMIAGSQTLKNLHTEARQWLVAHGREAEAEAILGAGQGTSKSKSKPGGGKASGAGRSSGGGKSSGGANSHSRPKKKSQADS
jgi:uncharacterized membrane protein YgcG